MPKITKRVLDALKKARPSEGQIFIRDTAIPGFGVRVTPGAICFILEKKIKGRPRRMTLGQFGVDLTVDQARGKAIELCGRIAAGEDPAQERIDERHELTFGELMDLYMERHAKEKKRSWKNDEQMIKRHLEPWRNRRLSSITSNDISLLHSKVGEGHGRYEANRLIAMLRKAFNLATLWGYWRDRNPAQGIELFKETKRDRFILPHELPRLMEALKQEESQFVQAAFLLCLFLGQRKNEILKMKWNEIDRDQAVWRIPETKSGRSHVIPLPAPVLQILDRLPRFDDNPFVFPGRKPGSHLVNIDKPWREIRKKAGLDDVRIHDARRTVGSWLAGSGASLPLIGKVLGHSQPSTTAIYARLDLAPVRAALEANAERMLLAAAKKPENGDSKEGPASDDSQPPQPTPKV